VVGVLNLRSACVFERAQAFVTKGDETVTVRPEKIHAELEKAGADPDFVRCMISREDLDGEYQDLVFCDEDSDSDMDMGDDDMWTNTHTLSLSCLLYL